MWALVDWDNTMRPGFSMIDWVDYLSSQELISPALVACMRKHERSWQDDQIGYHDFIQSIISIYRRAEPTIDSQLLRRLARRFVFQDTSFLAEASVASTLLELFQDLDIRVHVVSGAPLVILREYQHRHWCIKRVTGISSGNDVIDLFKLKRDAAQTHSQGSALFGIGDSETDIPLFEAARYPIGINFAPQELIEKGGISVKTTADLILSHDYRDQLSSYIRRTSLQLART